MKPLFENASNKLSEEDLILITELAVNPDSADLLIKKTLDKNRSLTWKPWPDVLTQFRNLPSVKARLRIEEGEIALVPEGPLIKKDTDVSYKLAQTLIPWKKGPFDLFGLKIDAEWQSQLKWDRLRTHLPSLNGKRILDIGCNNGYYMFQCLSQNPQFVLGLDPFQRPYFQFHLFQHFLKDTRLAFQMWGWEELQLMKPSFDLILCMGIIYHHRNPFQVLKNVLNALKPGGEAVVETIVIPGEESTCLVPEDRYAKMRNVWFIPTVRATENFLKRSGFRDIRCVSDVLHLPEEQRSTPWNPAPSFSEFLSTENPHKTIEGYPAPRRAILTARR
jgi:tRNA (mo5U34)-methyltransferase